MWVIPFCCCCQQELIPPQRRSLLVCVRRSSRSKCLHPHKERNRVNRRTPAHTNTRIYTRSGTQMRAARENRELPSHRKVTTHAHVLHTSVWEAVRAHTHTHTGVAPPGECGVGPSGCTRTGWVNAVNRVWWLREPEHTRCNPILHDASKTNTGRTKRRGVKSHTTGSGQQGKQCLPQANRFDCY